MESELTDILLRRRDELRSKIDSFDESEAQQGDSVGVDVDASRREVARLAKAVEGQTAKLDGEFLFPTINGHQGTNILL